MSNKYLPAFAPSLLAVVSWGGMFPIADRALRHVDAFNLTAIRYGAATAIFAALLVAVEGRRALRYEGRFVSLLGLGALGFAGFNLLVYVGLQHTQPQNAALIVATMPLVTVLVRWARDGVRPAPATLGLIAVALAGVGLVVTKGSLHATVGAGDGLVLIGVVGWVLYTMGAQRHPDLSPLRYTTLSAIGGTLTILAATAVADLGGWQTLPAPGDVGAAWLGLAYIVVFGAAVGVLAWNAGIRRIGAANGVLFMNLVPVTTFAIEIARGYRPVGAELAGAGLTVAALVAANLLGRRATATATATETETAPAPRVPAAAPDAGAMVTAR
jgi:drug/metabolite transporter (DMT)-like permease